MKWPLEIVSATSFSAVRMNCPAEPDGRCLKKSAIRSAISRTTWGALVSVSFMPIDQAIAICQDEVNRGNLNAEIWQLFLDRKIYNLFAGESGFIARPTAPILPSTT